MVLCRVNLSNVSDEDLGILKSFYFTPLEQLVVKDDGRVILNFMGGELCEGVNDLGDSCKECRYQPEIVLRYLRNQNEIKIGE
ncbi:MAG: hypothetical protein ACE5J5_05705 [Candidatus Hydrothermarchaeales archaeon]